MVLFITPRPILVLSCTTSVEQGACRPISCGVLRGLAGALEEEEEVSGIRGRLGFSTGMSTRFGGCWSTQRPLGREGRVFGECRGTLALASVGGRDMWQW